MRRLFTLTLLILALTTFAAKANDIDSLKQKLQLTTNDTLKGAIYTQIAAQYLKYDTLVNRNVKSYYQTEAIHYTMLALHNYSYYTDSIGIRTSFDDLAKVYTSQKKYSQAKWFILQSNSISRIKKDLPNLISSLIRLATVKMELKEYKMAMRDLNEALTLSVKNKMPAFEAQVQQNYAYLYNRLKDYDKGDLATQRAETILANISQAEDARLAAHGAGQDSVQVKSVPVKKTVPLVKKKSYAVSAKKVFKLNTAKKLASL
jgi:tetratricopeptide (TPR) repeat protein